MASVMQRNSIDPPGGLADHCVVRPKQPRATNVARFRQLLMRQLCLANMSAVRMARSIMVKVGLALPEEGKTEALTTLRLGTR